ncbi:MAG: hypothetical protein SVP52_04815 [Chloroflexota bacterium]|nr:hypothetical protein [Chloroflexota bacterium]
MMALVITLAIALVWLRIKDYFAHKGWAASHTSRKIFYIDTGTIFVLLTIIYFVIWIFIGQGYLTLALEQSIIPIAIIALSATIVESIHFEHNDNITIPLVAVLIGMVF